MIIIVESGATKTDWCAAAQDREPIDVRTAGMNLATMPQDIIEGIVAEAMGPVQGQGTGLKGVRGPFLRRRSDCAGR